jgi:hypothetical protein
MVSEPLVTTCAVSKRRFCLQTRVVPRVGTEFSHPTPHAVGAGYAAGYPHEQAARDAERLEAAMERALDGDA